MLPLVEKSQRGDIDLILASGSARRKFIFDTVGFKFSTCTSNFPEDLDKAQFPSALKYVEATSRGKIDALPPPSSTKTIQITCDTVVVVGSDEGQETILEKPIDLDDAVRMIKSILGKQISVISVVHLRSSKSFTCFHEISKVNMRGNQELSDDLIQGYLSTVNFTDFSAGLAIQSSGMVMVDSIVGCYHNVMGFPMSKFYSELSKFYSQ